MATNRAIGFTKRLGGDQAARKLAALEKENDARAKIERPSFLIQRAIDNGWLPLSIAKNNLYYEVSDDTTRIKFGYKLEDNKKIPIIEWSVYGTIFNLEFAQALWGEAVINNGAMYDGQPAWEYHLKKAVVCEDPVSYMYRQFFE